MIVGNLCHTFVSGCLCVWRLKSLNSTSFNGRRW